MKVHKKISKYNNSERGEFKYIVIHYIGAVSSAKNNAIYFAGGDRQASAHYYVDHEIWQGTKLSRASWHCGGAKRGTSGGKLYGKVKNYNSIGIEMCIKRKDGKYYVTNATIEQLKKLVPYLMKKFNIPKENVVRHYDVNGKKCPNCYTEDNFKATLIDNKRWEDFRNEITASYKGEKYKGLLPKKTINKRIGNKSDIKRWQKFLCWFGKDTAIDGSFGPDTIRKTKAFQRKVGIAVDGSVGAITRAEAKAYRK